MCHAKFSVYDCRQRINARCIDDRHAMLWHSGSLGTVVEQPGG
jgi:hypothetical protein